MCINIYIYTYIFRHVTWLRNGGILKCQFFFFEDETRRLFFAREFRSLLIVPTPYVTRINESCLYSYIWGYISLYMEIYLHMYMKNIYIHRGYIVYIWKCVWLMSSCESCVLPYVYGNIFCMYVDMYMCIYICIFFLIVYIEHTCRYILSSRVFSHVYLEVHLIYMYFHKYMKTYFFICIYIWKKNSVYIQKHMKIYFPYMCVYS